MAVVTDAGGWNDDGQRDARRHHDRVRRQISERLRERIGEVRLITAGPEHRIRVPVAGSREYRFIFDRGQGTGAGSGDVRPGDVLGGAPGRGDGAGGGGDGAGPGEAGDGAGSEEYEVWLDRDEVAQILFEQLGLPPLRRRADRRRVESATVTFDDRARRGAVLDKKATVRENLLRNAARGELRLGGFERDDLRYLAYREERRPKRQAVVFMLLDASASMGTFEKRCARLFLWWSVQFLRSRYTDTELVFIAHTTEARECTEDELFQRVESGGTRVSSACALALELQRRRYPMAEWDVVVLHASDGDNDVADNPRVLELVGALADALLIGYLQIDRAARFAWAGQHLLGVLGAHPQENLVTTRVARDEEIWGALKAIFRPAPEEVGA